MNNLGYDLTSRAEVDFTDDVDHTSTTLELAMDANLKALYLTNNRIPAPYDQCIKTFHPWSLKCLEPWVSI